MSQARIGTSGYQYNHWRGNFYPHHLPRRDWLSHYADSFDTVEINNTFYRLPGAATFRSWRRVVPGEFCFALKFSRYGSHFLKLNNAAAALTTFIKHAAALGPQLGPILVQLPPHWHVDPARLENFLAACPERQRMALEFRDRSWLCAEVYDILRVHDAALCIHDRIENHPFEVTASWVYLRFHGAADGQPYSHQLLTAHARRVKHWLDTQRDVYIYFNNDARGAAPEDARRLQRYLASAAADAQ